MFTGDPSQKKPDCQTWACHQHGTIQGTWTRCTFYSSFRRTPATQKHCLNHTGHLPGCCWKGGSCSQRWGRWLTLKAQPITLIFLATGILLPSLAWGMKNGSRPYFERAMRYNTNLCSNWKVPVGKETIMNLRANIQHTHTHTQKTGDPLEGFLLWWKQSKVYWSRKRTRTEENNYVAEYFRQECSWEARKMQSSFVVAAEFKIINSETEVGGKLFHLPKHHKWPPQPPDLATAPSIFEPRIFQHYWGKPSFSHNCKPSLQRQPPSVRVHVCTHTHTSHMHAQVHNLYLTTLTIAVSEFKGGGGRERKNTWFTKAKTKIQN